MTVYTSCSYQSETCPIVLQFLQRKKGVHISFIPGAQLGCQVGGGQALRRICTITGKNYIAKKYQNSLSTIDFTKSTLLTRKINALRYSVGGVRINTFYKIYKYFSIQSKTKIKTQDTPI